MRAGPFAAPWKEAVRNSRIPDCAYSVDRSGVEAAIVSGKLKPFAGPLKDQAGTLKVAAGESLPDEQLRGITWLVEGVQGTLPQK